jgi:hypothetical protein
MNYRQNWIKYLWQRLEDFLRIHSTRRLLDALGAFLGFRLGKSSITFVLGALGQTFLKRINLILVHFHINVIGGTDPEKMENKSFHQKSAHFLKKFLMTFSLVAKACRDFANSSKYCNVMQFEAYRAISSS